MINVHDHGAVGDGVADDTQALQSALDLARSMGGAAVYLPPGTYQTAPLTLGQRVRLAGAGFRSILKHGGGSGHLLSTYDTSVDLLQIADLSLECWQQSSGNAIHLANSASGYSSGYNDTHHSLRDVLIIGSAGAGVFLTNGAREARLTNVVVRDPRGGHGFHVEGTDNFFDLCTVATSRTPNHGFYVHASNNRFVGCKAFFCGQAGQASDGWYIDRGRNTFAACEAQDCGRWGFNFTGSAEVSTAVGLLADSNAAGGIVVDNTSGNLRGLSLSGFTTFSRTNGRYPQPVGIRFVGNLAGGSFVGTSRNNVTKDIDGSPTGATALIASTTGDVGTVFDSSRFLEGIGSPEGVVTASIGTSYVDTAATGGAVTWLKASGTEATGWQVQHGDTGRRDIKALLDMTNQVPYTEPVYLRRVGATVSFTAGFRLAAAPPSPVTVINLPIGFRPQNSLTYGPNSYAGRLVVWRKTGVVHLYGGVPNGIERVTNTYFTSDPWPTTLPGVTS